MEPCPPSPPPPHTHIHGTTPHSIAPSPHATAHISHFLAPFEFSGSVTVPHPLLCYASYLCFLPIKPLPYSVVYYRTLCPHPLLNLRSETWAPKPRPPPSSPRLTLGWITGFMDNPFTSRTDRGLGLRAAGIHLIVTTIRLNPPQSNKISINLEPRVSEHRIHETSQRHGIPNNLKITSHKRKARHLQQSLPE